ncbi:MAG: RsmB/NOP family class I SAM-dependent RNA methyltransferase [Pseudomonadota bacterium]
MTVADDAGLPAREAAAQILETALARRAGLDEALAGGAAARLPPRERAFARALAMAALRRLGVIDRMLEPRLRRPPPERVRTLLRLGAAQLFWLDVPDHAAVSTTVALADRDRATRPFKGLVNAVLRGLLRDGPPADDPAALAPPWLLARWTAAYGPEAAGQIAAAIAREPATDLSLRDPAEAGAVAAALEGDVLPGGGVRTTRRGDLADWPGYAEGRWWVQDAGAAIPARLLAVGPGETALDLCAAPGGKTLQLAAAGAATVAVDRSAERLKRLSANLERVGLAAEVHAADAAAWNDGRRFDAVLLDAPCSATGTFRRQPDVLWTAAPGDIARLAQVQARLLEAAADRVKPGGRLVYCVCSLEPEEGEAQVRAFLARRADFRPAPPAPGEGGAPAASLTPDGWLRILPHHLAGGIDGFFAARLTRA